MVAGQKVALGRQVQQHPVTGHVSETTFAIDLPDGGPASCDGPPTSRFAATRDSCRGPLPPQFPSQSVKHPLTQIRQRINCVKMSPRHRSSQTPPTVRLRRRHRLSDRPNRRVAGLGGGHGACGAGAVQDQPALSH